MMSWYFSFGLFYFYLDSVPSLRRGLICKVLKWGRFVIKPFSRWGNKPFTTYDATALACIELRSKIKHKAAGRVHSSFILDAHATGPFHMGAYHVTK